MEFELSGINVEINDLHKQPIGREKAQKPQNRPWAGTGLVIESATLHSPALNSRKPYFKEQSA
jgi:hypothetical protein